MNHKIRNTSLIGGIAIALCTITALAAPLQEPPNVYSTAVAQYEGGQEEDISYALDFSPYKSFGLAYTPETDQLFYEGTRVRYFLDEYAISDGTAIVTEYLDEGGGVDVYVQRDLSAINREENGAYDPGGTIINVLPYSQEEFDARDLDALSNPPFFCAAETGDPMSPEERAALYEEYTPFGLLYHADTDSFTFEGKPVRYFLDILESNGEALDSGLFEGAMRVFNKDDGLVDVYTLRDHDRPDGNGFGALTGVKPYSPEAFNARTLD